MRRSVGEARRKRDAQERGQWDGKRLADVLRCSETAHEVIQRAEAEARRLREFGRARFAALPAQKHALLSPEVVQALEEPVRETVTPTDLHARLSVRLSERQLSVCREPLGFLQLVSSHPKRFGRRW